jgi:hypothetical protein
VEILGEDADLYLPEMAMPMAMEIPETVPFEPHVMIDPATGTEYIARTMQEHLDYAAMGYIHKEEM